MYRAVFFAWNSGVGKDALALWLSQQDPNFIVSKARITTREPRKNESDITFVDATTFDAREKAGRIIGAYEGIGGHRYGIDTDILRAELQNKHPILPFWGDTLEIQQKYLMDLAWFCRENWFPLPLYFLLSRSDLETQEADILARWLPKPETHSRLNRMNNKNAQITRWPIIRLYEWLYWVDNIPGKMDISVEHLLWLFNNAHKSMGNRFFKERHERP